MKCKNSVKKNSSEESLYPARVKEYNRACYACSQIGAVVLSTLPTWLLLGCPLGFSSLLHGDFETISLYGDVEGLSWLPAQQPVVQRGSDFLCMFVPKLSAGQRKKALWGCHLIDAYSSLPFFSTLSNSEN